MASTFAVRAHVQMDGLEKDKVLDSLMAQKVGMNFKVIKEFKTFKQMQTHSENENQWLHQNENLEKHTIKLKIQKFALSAPVRWKRQIATNNETEKHEDKLPIYQIKLIKCT